MRTLALVLAAFWLGLQATVAAPKEPAPAADYEFDGGSRISLDALTPTQIDNLTTLGQVWGFLKYRHPAVTSGRYQWDYALFRVLPTILAAGDRATGNAAILNWVNGLKLPSPCKKCARLDERNLHLRPNLAWIEDEAVLGHALSAKLRAIEQNRPRGGRQFYVSLLPNIGSPVFERELPYDKIKFPDAGFQILALYRFWNAVDYWSPYRDIIGEDWHRVLREFIPRIALANTFENYRLQLWALMVKLRDGHALLRNVIETLPPTGDCSFQLDFRFVEGRPVIGGIADKHDGPKIGDVVTAIDGTPVEKLLESWRPYYPASNDWAQRNTMATFMGRGPCGDGSLEVLRGDQSLVLRPTRTNEKRPDTRLWHDLPGPTFRMLSNDIAYLKLSSVKALDVVGYMEAAAGAKGLIVDIRNYPSDFVVYALTPFLITKPTPFALITIGDLEHPGAFRWSEPPAIPTYDPHFPGKVVILVDEVTRSSAEYTAMALRAAPRSVVIGSPTAGADGNISMLKLPGGFVATPTGIGIFYPDKRPTQRLGIIPDILVPPTIQGIRDRRDEVLEEAVRQIVGPDAAPQVIRDIAKTQG